MNFWDRKTNRQALDLSGVITHECWCGSNMFNVPCIFEDGEIVFYALDMECSNCGSRYTAPTPLDGHDNNQEV